jgi:hypothetical protein
MSTVLGRRLSSLGVDLGIGEKVDSPSFSTKAGLFFPSLFAAGPVARDTIAETLNSECITLRSWSKLHHEQPSDMHPQPVMIAAPSYRDFGTDVCNRRSSPSSKAAAGSRSPCATTWPPIWLDVTGLMRQCNGVAPPSKALVKGLARETEEVRKDLGAKRTSVRIACLGVAVSAALSMFF